MLYRLPSWMIACLLFCAFTASAQQQRRFNAPSLFEDSTEFSSGDYMLHIEEVYQTLDRIKNESGLRYDILAMQNQLSESDTALKAISDNLNAYTKTLNIRNLQTYRVLLQSIQQDLKAHRDDVNQASDKLQALKKEMSALRGDTLLWQVMGDSVLRKTYRQQFRDLRRKWRNTDSTLQASLYTINQLKTHVSAAAIKSASLLTKVSTNLTQMSMRVFGKESPFLWEADLNGTPPALQQQVRKSYQGERKALNYYFNDAEKNRFYLLLFAAFFYWWLIRNIRRVKKMSALSSLSSYNIHYISRQPLVCMAVLVLCIAPLFDLDAPAGYIGTLQFFLLIILSFVCWKQWPRPFFYAWIGVIVLFFLLETAILAVQPTMMNRVWFILLNIVSAALWLFFLFRTPENIPLRRFVRFALILNIVLNGLAVLCNIFGRVTLSQLFGITALASFIQVIALATTYKIFMESLMLQVLSGRLKRGITNTFDINQITDAFRKPMLFVVILIWLIVFTTNMNVYNNFYEFFFRILEKKRTFGSIPFSFSSIALFILIIWAAHTLQRYISYFFGEVNDDEDGPRSPRSKLIVTRLIVLSLGYLLAVAASGLPVDKITIVLGALGVGIGMGLQNIVNNFVSGIVLIFDRPLQIGDAVEIGGTSGRVKEIGLRASTLYTQDGAEVIIPNGDILSQHITNWTLSNTNKRLTLSLSLLTDYDKEQLISLIKSTILSSDNIYTKREPQVIVESVKEGTYGLTIYFWCTDVQKADWIRSEVRYQLYHVLRENRIVVQ